MPGWKKQRYGRGRKQQLRYKRGKLWLKKKHFKKTKVSTRTGHLSVQQKVFDQSLTIDAGNYPNGIIYSMEFKGSDVEQFPTFATLFDQYRINAVKVTMLPTTNQPSVSNPAATFASSVDLDGGTPPATFDELLQCSNARTSPWSAAGGLTPYKSVYCKPRFGNAVITDIDAATGQPTQFTIGLGSRKQWLDISDRGNTVHHGINFGWYFGQATVSNTQNINMVITYYLQFRKVR